MNKNVRQEYQLEHGTDRLVVDLSYQFPLSGSLHNIPEILMQKMQLLLNSIQDSFINKRNYDTLRSRADEYLLLAARLRVIADQRLLDAAADKVKYAAHPTFYP